MHISLNTSKWYDRLWGALIFFTRLPLLRLHEPRRNAFSHVVEWWPLAGWLTGGVMAAVLWLGSFVFDIYTAVILAIVSRLLLTGALHEDGLADFFDGFGGGGGSRQRTLDIMKDSHIGTYGVLALVCYMLLLFATLTSMQPADAALTILTADPYAKMVSAQMIQMMPYARTEQTAKNQTVYAKFNAASGICLAVQGMVPLALYCWYFYHVADWQLLVFVPALVMYFLYLFIWRRLRGYTGDCCGAMFLLTELSFYLVAAYYLGLG